MTFNWQTERESILRWLIPEALVKSSDGPLDREGELHKTLNEATEGWTKVNLAIVINGVVLDGEWFMHAIEHHLDNLAEKMKREASTVSKEDVEYAARELRNLLEDVLPLLEKAEVQ